MAVISRRAFARIATVCLGMVWVAGCGPGPAPVATTAPTLSPPTATPLPPPRPTITRLPLVPPSAAPSAAAGNAAAPVVLPADVAYLDMRGREYDAALKALSDLENQVALVQRGTAKVGNADWQARTRQDLGALQTASHQFTQGGAVPPDLAQLDALFVKAGRDLLTAVGQLETGIQKNDAPAVVKTMRQFQRVDADMMKINQQLTQARQRDGLSG